MNGRNGITVVTERSALGVGGGSPAMAENSVAGFVCWVNGLGEDRRHQEAKPFPGAVEVRKAAHNEHHICLRPDNP